MWDFNLISKTNQGNRQLYCVASIGASWNALANNVVTLIVSHTSNSILNFKIASILILLYLNLLGVNPLRVLLCLAVYLLLPSRIEFLNCFVAVSLFRFNYPLLILSKDWEGDSREKLNSILRFPCIFINLSLLYLVSPLGFELNPHLEDWQGMSNTFHLGGLAGSLNPPSLRAAEVQATRPTCWFCFLQVGVTVAS